MITSMASNSELENQICVLEKFYLEDIQQFEMDRDSARGNANEILFVHLSAENCTEYRIILRENTE